MTFQKDFLCVEGFPDSSVGKESTYNAGNPPFNSWVGKICWRFLGFPCGWAGKESACNVGDLGSIPGLGRSPGEGKGCPLQYSGLENSTDCIVRGVAKSQTQLSDFHFHLCVWTIFKVFIECVTILLLFHVLIFLVGRHVGLSSLTRVWICTPCIWRWSLNWKGSPLSHDLFLKRCSYVSFRCITQWFDICIHYAMIIRRSLAAICPYTKLL